MEPERRLHRPRPTQRQEDEGQDPSGASSVLESARGWAGSAREAVERLEAEDARALLETARRNGPGQ